MVEIAFRQIITILGPVLKKKKDKTEYKNFTCACINYAQLYIRS